MSPGWQPRALQIASSVDNRIAFALPFLRIEMLAMVMPTFSARSVTLIFRLASITSMLMMIAILSGLHRQVVFGFQIDCALQSFLKYGCRGGCDGRDEDEKKPHHYTAC